MKEAGRIFIPSIGPGYDDEAVRPWNGENTKDRQTGQYYVARCGARTEADGWTLPLTALHRNCAGVVLRRVQLYGGRQLRRVHHQHHVL